MIISVSYTHLLIDEADKAGYKLYVEENANGEIDPFMSYQNLFLKRFDEGNTEILFARPSSDYGSYEKHATPAAKMCIRDSACAFPKRGCVYAWKSLK